MPLMALAAQEAGAKGIRANSVRDIQQIKEKVSLPVIGIIKKAYDGYDAYITATLDEISQLVAIGTDIIALDSTKRSRGDDLTPEAFIRKIIRMYPDQLFMADISSLEEGMNARKPAYSL